MDYVLTDEQRKIASEYEYLIRVSMEKLHLYESDLYDWYGAFAEALCYASNKYDSSRGMSFKSYAIMCIRGAYKEGLRYMDIAFRKLVNFDSQALGDGDMTSKSDFICKLNYLLSTDPNFLSFYINDTVKKVYDKLNDLQKKIIRYNVLIGYSCRETAELCGTSRQTVSIEARRFKERVISIYNGIE